MSKSLIQFESGQQIKDPDSGEMLSLSHIVLTFDSVTVALEMPEDWSIGPALDAMRQVLLGFGFDQDAVDNAIPLDED